jgi:hypothetical protein
VRARRRPHVLRWLPSGGGRLCTAKAPASDDTPRDSVCLQETRLELLSQPSTTLLVKKTWCHVCKAEREQIHHHKAQKDRLPRARLVLRQLERQTLC